MKLILDKVKKVSGKVDPTWTSFFFSIIVNMVDVPSFMGSSDLTLLDY